MIKSSFLVCCLVLAASAAPAPEPAKPESKSGEKAAKLQWAPEDAQQSVYAQSIAIPEQQTVIRVAKAPSQTIIKSVAQSPLYLASAAPAPRPYSSSRTIITTTGQSGQLPEGHVWEHYGDTHIGHTSKSIHVKKQGSLTYAVSAPSSSIAGTQILSSRPQVYSVSSNSAARGGQIAIIGGRQAQQQQNGQWTWLSQAAPAASSASWNSAWNSQSSLSAPAPAYQTIAFAAPQPQSIVYAQQPQPQTVTLVEQQQPQTISISAQQPQSIVYAQQQPQSVVYSQKPRQQTVTVVEEQQPQSVVYSQKPRQQTVTLVEEQQPQSIVYAQQQPQSVVYSQQPQQQTVTLVEQQQPQAVVYAQKPQQQTVTLIEQQQPQPQTISIAAPEQQSVVYAQQQPQTVTLVEQQQPKTLTISQRRPALAIPSPAVQTVKTYTQEISSPAVDSKWYTKTNRAVIQPFYAQSPQYVEIAQASQTSKTQAASPVKPESEDEADWK